MILYQDPISKKCFAKDPETDQLYELVPLVRLPVVELANKLQEIAQEEREDDETPILDKPHRKQMVVSNETKALIREYILQGKKNNIIAKEIGCTYSLVYQIRMSMI